MKIAALCESPADELAVRILVEAVLGEQTDATTVGRHEARAGGFGTILNGVLPSVINELHYQRIDTDGLIIVIDTDNSPVHQLAHELPGKFDGKCHLCELQRKISEIQGKLSVRPWGEPLRIAVGTPSPCIEAWYLYGKDPHVGEVEWERTRTGKPYSREHGNALKRRVYGTDRPALELEKRCAEIEARRIADLLPDFEAMFPGGFGALAREVRSWRK